MSVFNTNSQLLRKLQCYLKLTFLTWSLKSRLLANIYPFHTNTLVKLLCTALGHHGILFGSLIICPSVRICRCCMYSLKLLTISIYCSFTIFIPHLLSLQPEEQRESRKKPSSFVGSVKRKYEEEDEDEEYDPLNPAVGSVASVIHGPTRKWVYFFSNNCTIKAAFSHRK